MNQVDFLKDKLQFLNKICPYLNIRYEYKNYTNTHIIDIRPQNLFEADKAYIYQQVEIEDEFEERFPFDNIIFISEDSLTKLDNPIFELEASSINEIKVVFEEAEIGELFEQDLVEGYSKNYYQCIEDEDYLLYSGCISNNFELPLKEKHKPPSKWFKKLKSKGSNATLEPFFI